jgi:hypothetical protein
MTIHDHALETARPAFCHCANCRRQSGATGSYVMTLKDGDFEVEGKPKDYLDKKTDSGTPLHRWFCGDCGRSGFDDGTWFQVANEIPVQSCLRHRCLLDIRVSQVERQISC